MCGVSVLSLDVYCQISDLIDLTSSLTCVSDRLLQFTLLTGVFPIHDECSQSKVGNHIRKGEIPYIDPRWSNHSFAEGELVRITTSCFAYDPGDRPSMGDLVRQLRRSVVQNRKVIAEDARPVSSVS